MRIKQIELNGFKSFMQRTVIELPAGVTGVVGPNGCGKSNVVDAIRWVLGEQSPKHLRGSAMEDVVFAGNTENGPVGMAEVSLLLERDEHDLAEAAADAQEAQAPGGLPPELANASEVLVTRRYFRSGESEYFINRAPCRLKDITELFLGTGVGTKAYAIIEQGRVEQLVNAKPDELRLFIEEAAGTTRFRSRKVAAERKMERTRDNLLRVQDVLRELERQMASLERQARRAEEYHRIKDELRDLDLRVMAGRHRTWVAEIQDLGARIAALHDEDTALQADIRRVQGESGESREERNRRTERLRAVEEESTRQRLVAGEAHVRASALASRSEELRARAAAADDEATRLRAQGEALAADLEALAAAVHRLREDTPAAEAERQAAEERLEALMAAGTPLEHALEQAKDAHLDAVGEEMRARNTGEALRQRRDELAGQRRRLDDDQHRLGERLRVNHRGLEASRGTLARLEEERRTVVDRRHANALGQQDVARREAAQLEVVEKARAEATRLASRADSLRELQARHEGCTRGVASLLERPDQEGALLASVLRVPAALERAVAAALGARLTQLVVPGTVAAVGAVTWLGQTGGGSATVVPRDPERRAPVIVPPGRRLVDQIEVDPQHWALAEALLGHVLLADTLDEALRVWRSASHPVTVVTPAGEAIDTLGAVSGGSEAPFEETVLARQRELRELQAALETARARVAREDAALADIRLQLAQAGRAVAEAEERLQAIQLESIAAEKDRERLEEERARIGAELEVGALEVGNLVGQDGALASEIDALTERVAAGERLVMERRVRLAEQQAALARWRDEHASAERTRTDTAVRAAAQAERLRAAEAELERCQARRADVGERLALATHEAEESAGGAELAAREANEAATTHARATTAGENLEQERTTLLGAIAHLDAALVSEDAEERGARDRLEVLREERAALDLTLAERRMAVDHLRDQLAERYGLGLDALAEIPSEDDGLADQRAERVEQLRARLLRLGDVNPGALAELGELRQRHEFLVAQRADLEASLDDLKRTISHLTRTSRTRFEETFAAANEKLSEVFPRLFPNGKARLELTEPGEDGEQGVEIVVQPAGKKLQSLSLLSGGEKALTAVSLILSLFLIRPTPFCLLDEVDAPLDEANIGRFNELIRQMAATSQFVLITHNRRTMEAADTLYGITMEEAGVSKVVSVKLREAA